MPCAFASLVSGCSNSPPARSTPRSLSGFPRRVCRGPPSPAANDRAPHIGNGTPPVPPCSRHRGLGLLQARVPLFSSFPSESSSPNPVRRESTTHTIRRCLTLAPHSTPSPYPWETTETSRSSRGGLVGLRSRLAIGIAARHLFPRRPLDALSRCQLPSSRGPCPCPQRVCRVYTSVSRALVPDLECERVATRSRKRGVTCHAHQDTHVAKALRARGASVEGMRARSEHLCRRRAAPRFGDGHQCCKLARGVSHAACWQIDR
eukprot:scaffold13668_cov72-Phaeocystis_antarctica.AAC.2